MKLNISAKNSVITDTFKGRIEKKLNKLDKFFEDDATANVVVSTEKNRETVEITVKSRDFYFRAEKTTLDMLDSLEVALDNIVKQIVKNKDKLTKKLHSRAFEPEYNDAAELKNDYSEIAHSIVKQKRFALKQMSESEALLQMEMLGHSFFVFRDAADALIKIVYRRNDGDYGLIIPE